MKKSLAFWDNESYIVHLIKDDLIKYKIIADLKKQLYQASDYKSTLITAILVLLKVWESKLQEEFTEYYHTLIKVAETSRFSARDKRLTENAQDIFEKLKKKSVTWRVVKIQGASNPACYDQSPILLNDRLRPVKK